MRIVVILFLVAILYCLGSAFYYMIRSSGKPDSRVLQQLTVRVALSVGLFALLMVSYKLGWIGDKI